MTDTPTIPTLNLIDVQERMQSMEEHAIDLPLEHHHGGGVYMRTVLIPKGALVVGKRHRHQTLNIVLKGDCSVYLDLEGTVTRMQAPNIFNSMANEKKMVYAHEDTLFSNVHPTGETDIEIIEKEFIISEEEFAEMTGGASWRGQ